MVEKWIRMTLICDALDILFPGLLLLREWEKVGGSEKEKPIFKAVNWII